MREHPLDSYKRWWVGKYCRLAGSHGPFRLVADVSFSGSPSGFKGQAELIYEDGTREWIRLPFSRDHDVFRPRKKDVEIWPEHMPPPQEDA